MADWYVSSAKYATVAVWQATHAYVVGDLIKPTAPAAGREYVFRCTTAGTSGGTEPTWSTANANNATRTDGTATWTNVSGQSTYGWNAAAGTIYCISGSVANRPVVGDRVFLSSDHSETGAGGILSFSSAGFGLIQLISVNRAGSVPPVAADITVGAAIGYSGGAWNIEAVTNLFAQGITFTQGAASNLNFNSTSNKFHYFKDCAFVCSNAAAAKITNSDPANVCFDNTTVKFGNVGGAIGAGAYPLDLTWINTPSAVQGPTLPTALFLPASSQGASLFTCRGVDLSAVTGTLLGASGSLSYSSILLDSCRIASGVTRYATPASSTNSGDEIELVNCFDGTSILNERYTPAGAVTIDRSTTLSGGAQDDVGAFSLKLVSSTRADFVAMPLDCFWFDVENTATGASKTATVEIISSGTLNNTDIKLQLQYMGTAGSSIASLIESLASVLTAASALSSSSVTWNNPPATPQKQMLQVTFTPQTVGRVRGLVRLGKTSATVWVNPQITIS